MRWLLLALKIPEPAGRSVLVLLRTIRIEGIHRLGSHVRDDLTDAGDACDRDVLPFLDAPNVAHS
jgi:hypothetical protein